MVGRVSLAVALTACSFEHGRLPGDTPDAGDSGGPLVFSIAPPIAGPGQLVAIDGALGNGDVTVKFASGVSVTTTGGEHAVVAVPPDAGTGTLVLSNAIGSNAGVALRAPTFAVALGTFVEEEAQTDFARVASRLPAPLAHAGVVANQRYVFVIGGEQGTTAEGTVLRARIYADGTLSAFEVAGALTTPRAGPAVAIAGTRLIVAGGRDGSNALDSTESATIAGDGTVSPFIAGPPLPAPRAYARAAIVGAAFVVAGGETSDGVPHADVYRGALARDGSLIELVPTASLQTARSRFGLVVAHSRLVALGGRGVGGSGISSVEAASINADGSLGSFLVGGSLGFARTGTTAFIAGGDLCVAGGELGTPRLEVECATLDPDGVATAFTTRSRLPFGRIGASAVLAPDRVWLVAGGRAPLAFAALDVGAVPGEFAAGAALAAPSRDIACALVGDQLYVLGGIDAGGIATSTIQRAPVDVRGTIGAFATYPVALMTARRGHQAAVLDGAVAIVGGANPGGDLGSTEVLAFDANADLQAPIAGSALTVERRGPRAAIVDRTLFVIGGRSGANPGRSWEAATASVKAIGSFSAGNTQIGTARAFYTTAVVGTNLIVFGSGTETDVEAAAATTVLGSFNAVGQLNAPRENHMAAWVGERLWAIGGFDANGTVTAIETATPVGSALTFAVEAAPALPAALATGGCAIRLRDHLHLVGGSANNVLAPTIYSSVLH